MKFATKTIFLAAALLGASLVGAETAGAMPVAPVTGAAQNAPIEQAGWRCGPGWHANPWGRCVPNHRRGWGPYRRHRW